ncbi:MAG TPA: DeoR/GlpR family DNA-binding transcription regulator [Candidatus Dormibacteraeota bacterium]|nr:DeoR/GlpR family DNA-binding transcription regulator [Candidatus Dormibacteraeota bacterium]
MASEASPVEAASQLKGERHLSILSILEREGRAEVRQLSQLLGVSEVTIRRDLRELDRQGVLVNVRGGALVSRGTGFEVPYAAKLGEHQDEKVRIARAACDRCQPGETVLLDAGTTVGAMTNHLPNSGLTVITNALNVINILARRGSFAFLVIGGEFRVVSQAFLGPRAVEALSALRIDRAFIGTEGIAADRGLQVPDSGDAAFKQAAVRAAREVVILADHSKFEVERLYTFASWNQVGELITGQETEPEAVARLRAMGVPVTVV